MRVLFVVFHWSLSGGLERVTVDLAQALLATGADLDIWSVFDFGTPMARGIPAVGLAFEDGTTCSFMARCRRKLYNRIWKYVLAIRVVLKARGYDLIISGHPHLLAPVIEGKRVASAESRCWTWVYGLDVWGDAGLPHVPSLRSADKVISISRYTAEQVSKWVQPSTLVIIPPAVDTDLFIPGDIDSVRRNEILIVGRIAASERYKGHDTLIEALPIVEKKLGRQVQLTIVGSGDDKMRVESLADSSPCRDRIRFAGRLPDDELRKAFQQCAVFAMPSRVECREKGAWTGEGFGIVYTEAAACGRPVVGSTDGGAPETIVDGLTGLLANPRSAEDVADKLVTLLANPSLADEMGLKGREFVEREFSVERFNSRVAALLRGGLER